MSRANHEAGRADYMRNRSWRSPLAMTIIHKNELFLKSHFPLPQITKNRSQNKKRQKKKLTL